MSELQDTLQDLEKRLLDPTIRASRTQVEDLLDDQFMEFGRSGRVYDKAAILAALAANPGFDGPRTLTDFRVRALSSSVALVTYRMLETQTLRSSVWRNDGTRWRMAFHQGTPGAIA